MFYYPTDLEHNGYIVYIAEGMLFYGPGKHPMHPTIENFYWALLSFDRLVMHTCGELYCPMRCRL